MVWKPGEIVKLLKNKDLGYVLISMPKIVQNGKDRFGHK